MSDAACLAVQCKIGSTVQCKMGSTVQCCVKCNAQYGGVQCAVRCTAMHSTVQCSVQYGAVQCAVQVLDGYVGACGHGQGQGGGRVPPQETDAHSGAAAAG